MPEKLFWGPHSEYGPYSAQGDGWPHRGEVMRAWRKAQKMTAKQVAVEYGKHFKGEPVSERWVTMAEKYNLIPKDEQRRRVLAGILGIPPILFGLGSLTDLAPVTTQAASLPQMAASGNHVQRYDTFLDLYWQLDYTSTAQGSLRDIESMINDLRTIAPQVPKNEQNRIFELLCGFYPLASTIYNDQLNHKKAFEYADTCVKLATNMGNKKMQAVALYQRGFVNLQQGTVGIDPLDPDYVQAAMLDFEQAIPLSVPRLEAAILLDLALAQALLKQRRAASLSLDKSARLLSKGKMEDGSFVDLFANINTGRYSLGKAAALIALKEYDEADSELDQAEELISPDQTRRHAWISVLRSQVWFGQGSYAVATETALNALKVCKGINSVNNITLIKNLYHQLTSDRCSYRLSRPVQQLGANLVLC
ncbi:hypothetical protein [Tengunoibacter tsumagoiensis]|uniref:HTH cro/C1-type domain-containing protein n=1 Tax=Tengunoibacter tsumagoiensis TaxID=2014871 RepID=A0A402A623_9CHLR|nr:hypothetical protein [Tengunoibacter tsumagoiensis]GCE14593.1 hypothetical protein KTT_44520 [Tengunoibacter tsumagoiensis]